MGLRYPSCISTNIICYIIQLIYLKETYYASMIMYNGCCRHTYYSHLDVFIFNLIYLCLELYTRCL